MSKSGGGREPLSRDELSYIRKYAFKHTDRRIAQALGRHEITIAKYRRGMVAEGSIEPPPNRAANGKVKRYVPVGTRLRNAKTGPLSEGEWRYIHDHLSDDPRDIAKHLNRYPIVVYNAIRKIRAVGDIVAPAEPEPVAVPETETITPDDIPEVESLAERLFAKYCDDPNFMLGLGYMQPYIQNVDHFMAINQDTPFDKRAMILAWVRKYLTGEYAYILLDITAPKGEEWVAAALDTLHLSGLSNGTIPPDVQLLVRQHSGESIVYVNAQVAHINGHNTMDDLFDLLTQRVLHGLR